METCIAQTWQTAKSSPVETSGNQWKLMEYIVHIWMDGKRYDGMDGSLYAQSMSLLTIGDLMDTADESKTDGQIA